MNLNNVFASNNVSMLSSLPNPFESNLLSNELCGKNKNINNY